ncbi:MAG: hypothetical protein AB1797_07190 [bacterium]
MEKVEILPEGRSEIKRFESDGEVWSLQSDTSGVVIQRTLITKLRMAQVMEIWTAINEVDFNNLSNKSFREEGKAKHRKLILEGKMVILTYYDPQDLPEALQKLLKLLAENVDVE